MMSTALSIVLLTCKAGSSLFLLCLTPTLFRFLPNCCLCVASSSASNLDCTFSSPTPAAEVEDDLPFVANDDGVTAAASADEDFPFLDGVHSASDYSEREYCISLSFIFQTFYVL